MKINGLAPQNELLKSIKPSENVAGNEGSDFLSMLKEKLDSVNDKQITAEETTESFIKGEDVDIHEVMLATEEAKMSLELAVQIRNKLVEAYQELNRMQL